jgi:hypothetical protein
MKTRKLHFKGWLTFSALAISCSLATPAKAQSTKPLPDTDTTRQELASFDQFLDSHRETAEQLRKDPSLVNNEGFMKSHPALQTYLQQHPQIREEIKESPETFMRKENRFDRPDYTRDRDTTRREVANFDQFLDSHRETAEQLRKDPSLVNNEQFVKSHSDLQAYLQQHPEVREEIKENPNAFMHQEVAMNAPKTLLEPAVTSPATATLPARKWRTSTSFSTVIGKQQNNFAKTLHS